MKTLKKLLLFKLFASFVIFSSIFCSQFPKEKINLLSAVTRSRPVQEIIADYLNDEWNLHKQFKERAYNIIFLDNNTLAFTDHSSNIYTLNIESLEKKVLGHGIVGALKFLPNKKYLISAERFKEWFVDGDRKIKIWNINTGHCIKTLDGHKNRDILSLACSNDEKFLASGSMCSSSTIGSDLKIWDIESGICIKTFTLDHDNQIDTLIFSNDGNYLFTGSHSGYIHLLDIKAEKDTIIDASRFYNIRSFHFSNNGKFLSHAGGNDKIRIFNIENLEKIHEAKNFNSEQIKNIRSIKFSPNGKYIVIAGSGEKESDYCGTIQIFDIKTFAHIKTLIAHQQIVLEILFSPNGKYLASIGCDGLIKLWKSTSNHLLEEIKINSDDDNIRDDKIKQENSCCILS